MVMRAFGDRGIGLAVVVISLACALGAWLFLYLGQRAALTMLEERAVDLAAMIADRARHPDRDLSPLGELVDDAGRFGGVLYLEVKVGDEVVLKSSGPEEEFPPPSPVPAGPTAIRVATSEGQGVAAFYPFRALERGTGYVWLVLAQPEPIRKGFGALAGVVSAVALAVDLSALAALSAWKWWRHGRSRTGEGRIRVGKLEIDQAAKQVYLAGKRVPLTPKEFALLSLLSSSPGRVFSSQEILEVVWPESRYADDKNVKQCVYSLRKKLGEAAPGGEELIATQPGFGYFLRPED